MREIFPTKTMQEPHESSLEQFVAHCRISYRSIHSTPRHVAAVVALADQLDDAKDRLAEAVRMIEGYKRAGWLTNPSAGEQATDFIFRVRATGTVPAGDK